MKNDKLIEDVINKDIFKIITKIKKCRSKSMYNILISDLMMLYELTDELNMPNVLDVDKYSYKNYRLNEIEILKDILDKYNLRKDFYTSFLHSYLELLNEKGYNSNTNKIYKNKLKSDFSLDDSVDLVGDFLSHNNMFLYNKFNELANEKHIFYMSDATNYTLNDGLAYFGLTNIFKPYILVYDQESILTSITFVHELGHIYDYERTKNNKLEDKINASKSNYQEFYSHFLELLFYDFLDNNNILKKDEVKIVKKLYNVNLYICLLNLQELLSKNISTKEDVYINYSDILSAPDYALGMVLAYEFYDMYKQDKDETTYNIENFLANYGSDNSLKSLDNYGLNKEKILSNETTSKYIF